MTIKSNSYFRIEAFMVNDLHLKGNALLVYAIIHSFSRGDGWFTGGLSYLSEWLSITKQGLSSIINKLVEEGFITADRQSKGCASIDRYRTTVSRERKFNVDDPSHVKETLTSR